MGPASGRGGGRWVILGPRGPTAFHQVQVLLVDDPQNHQKFMGYKSVDGNIRVEPVNVDYITYMAMNLKSGMERYAVIWTYGTRSCQ